MTSRKQRASGAHWRFAVFGALVLLAAALWTCDAVPDPDGWFVDDTKYRPEIVAAAGRHGIDPELVRAVIFRESRFDPRARGSRGEVGLMQVLPSGAAAEWARVLKRPRPSERDLFDVKVNLEVGCWYLARALRRWGSYDHGVELALAQYNAGASRAQKWAPPGKDGDVISRVNIASTRKYITKIMKRYRKYTADAAAVRK